MHRLHIVRALSFLSLVVAGAACGTHEATGASQVVSAPPTLSIVSGDAQTGYAGTALPTALAVKAAESSGVPKAGATVTFDVTSGTATLSTTLVPTDASGIASTRVTLGAQAGTVQVKSTLQGTTVTAAFNAVTRAAEPDSTLASGVYNTTWSEASHGKVSANYGTVFPQDAVNTIELRLTSAQWASIRQDMIALYGFDFGGRTQGGGQFPEDDPDYVAAELTANGKVWKKTGFRLKGNSTLSTAWGTGNYKLPFRLKLAEFEAMYPAIKSQRFYGFKELSFSPGRSDPSLIREKSAADIFRMAGVPAARTAFYRVFIDFGAGLRYVGLYTAVEVIDDTMVKDQFGQDNGNIYKPESAFRTFVVADFEKKNNKAAADYSDVQAAVAALTDPLRTSNAAQWRANLEATFNVDHFLRWLAVDNAIVNWDSYGTMAHNYYLYNHSAQRLTWIPWDHNESLTGSPGITGTAGGPPGPGRGLSLSMNEVSPNWPLIRYLLDDAVYLATYKTSLKRFNDEVLSLSAIPAMFDRYTALISPYVIGANGEKAGATYLATPAAFTNALPALKAHVQARVALVKSYLP